MENVPTNPERSFIKDPKPEEPNGWIIALSILVTIAVIGTFLCMIFSFSMVDAIKEMANSEEAGAAVAGIFALIILLGLPLIGHIALGVYSLIWFIVSLCRIKKYVTWRKIYFIVMACLFGTSLAANILTFILLLTGVSSK